MKIKTLIIGLIGLIMLQPMSVQAADCANGYGTEIKGNDHGTYCRSKVAMNWWSAHAWCDAIGMTLIPLKECECNDESKCDMTKQCPNLWVSSSPYVWIAITYGKNNAYTVYQHGGSIGSVERTNAGNNALCY